MIYEVNCSLGFIKQQMCLHYLLLNITAAFCLSVGSFIWGNSSGTRTAIQSNSCKGNEDK